MINLLDLAPISSPPVYPGPESQLNENDKHELEQLLNLCMSDPAFWHSEDQTVPKQASATKDNWKMEKLQEELETLKFFGAGIAHDLGNVLTVIIGNLELTKLYQEQE